MHMVPGSGHRASAKSCLAGRFGKNQPFLRGGPRQSYGLHRFAVKAVSFRFCPRALEPAFRPASLGLLQADVPFVFHV